MGNIIEYIILLLILYLLELLYFRIAKHFNIIDKPNERSSHKNITLRGGGIIFTVSALIYYIFHPVNEYYFLIGLLLITIISFWDDLKNIPSLIRLLIHLIALSLLFYQWGLWSYDWWYIILAFVLCAGIINAYNFMDGINGITGGYSFIIISGLVYVNEFIIHFVDRTFLFYILASLLVFNFFNFRKQAKCFAGDVGSISIAFIIVFLLGNVILTTKDISYLIFLVVYGVDAICTIIHRLILKENISAAHRKHAYQIMANELKIPHLKVAAIYIVLQALILSGYFILFQYRYIYFALAIIILIIAYIIFMKRYFHLHTKPITK